VGAGLQVPRGDVIEQPFPGSEREDGVGRRRPADPLRPQLHDRVAQPARVDPTPGAVRRLQDHDVGEAAVGEALGGRQAGDARPDDDHLGLALAWVQGVGLHKASLNGGVRPKAWAHFLAVVTDAGDKVCISLNITA